MNETDARYVFWAIYGAGLLIVYGLLLRRRLGHLHRHRDPRAMRDAIEGLGLFLVALAAALAITFALFGQAAGLGGIFSAVASAAFLVVGIYGLSEGDPVTANTSARRQ